MNFKCFTFCELSATQLYEILRLRSEVFVLEQNCIYQDMDGKDTRSEVQHLMMSEQSQVLGYARLLPPGISFDTASIGRIVISSRARHKGYGRLLIQESINRTHALWPNTPITIGAQSYLSPHYQSYGFIEVSEHYLEDGILHVDMQVTPV